MANAAPGQAALPIQPVDRPILCNPYEEPTAHWVYDHENGAATQMDGRRPASFWYRYEESSTRSSYQRALFAEQERDELPMVNALREDVKRWRASRYEKATNVTKELLAYWWRADRPRRLFFCQLEAVETVIYLNEFWLSGQKPRFAPQCTDDMLVALFDAPADPDFSPLIRMGAKMATGSGKTVVMALLMAWSFCNRGQVASDVRFPNAAVVVCPNLTIKERLQVLRPEHPNNYYAMFDLVPTRMRPLLQSGKVIIENWHTFLPQSEHYEAGKTYAVVNKGPEGPEAFAKRILGDLYDRAPILVFNDEAHHAWRPPLRENGLAEAEADVKAEFEEATVWVNGLDMLNRGASIRCCVDLSATPFYIGGSGHTEGDPFPWVVSDFGLVDAIESGIVKIPRLPISDTSGRPEPKYYRLWENINDGLAPGERLPGAAKKPKPDVVYKKAEDALLTLAAQWVERYGYIQEASDRQDKTPPVMIIVCDNTDIAEVFFRNISGEQEIEMLEEVNGKMKAVKRTQYSDGHVFPEYFSNREGFRPTIRIDSKLLAQAESGDPNISRQDAAEQLRRIVATVGRRSEPGEQVRCVVSVAMLTEGWDANNVTHILGLRAFGSQLLCEQVVGRGLRRIDYTPDPETGLLREEYVDIYGVPFSLIPFRGRKPKDTEPIDRPPNHVFAMEERKAFEMRFPVVEGYAFALRRNLITADIDAMQPLVIDPGEVPTATFVSPQVGYRVGIATLNDPFQIEEQTREAYYASTHLQAIEFQIAQQIVQALTATSDTFEAEATKRASLKLQSRHQLFPQVLRLVHAYVSQKVNFRGANPCELGQETYFRRVVERLLTAIRPSDEQGEAPLLPILNRYAPVGTTADVDFKTVRPCFATKHSHINQVAADTATWEQSAAFRLEQAVLHGIVKFYARNDGLGFSIPYEFMGVPHHYEPDFLIRLANDVMLVLEIKGAETEQDRAKHEAARRWRDAVNHWGELGTWTFHVCRDPQVLRRELEWIVGEG